MIQCEALTEAKIPAASCQILLFKNLSPFSVYVLYPDIYWKQYQVFSGRTARMCSVLLDRSKERTLVVIDWDHKWDHVNLFIYLLFNGSRSKKIYRRREKQRKYR